VAAGKTHASIDDGSTVLSLSLSLSLIYRRKFAVLPQNLLFGIDPSKGQAPSLQPFHRKNAGSLQSGVYRFFYSPVGGNYHDKPVPYGKAPAQRNKR
jgi:hypothetical protein